VAEFALVSSRSEDGITTIVVAGEIDLATAPELRDALLATRGDVTVDLAQVAFMDSTGLSALIAGRKHVIAAGHTFSVRNESELIEHTMKLTGVYDVLHGDGTAVD
jgi:anti-sigma B factor antagonist